MRLTRKATTLSVIILLCLTGGGWLAWRRWSQSVAVGPQITASLLRQEREGEPKERPKVAGIAAIDVVPRGRTGCNPVRLQVFGRSFRLPAVANVTVDLHEGESKKRLLWEQLVVSLG